MPVPANAEHFLPALLVVAAPIEASAILKGLASSQANPEAFRWNPTSVALGLDLVLTGIGKVNAAAATALSLGEMGGTGKTGTAAPRQNGRYSSVVSIGIGGALPNSPAAIGDTVIGRASAYADEGLLTPDKFLTCSDMGFPLGPFEGNAVPSDAGLFARLRPSAAHEGVIATVSTCSGVDRLAHEVQARAGAIVEAMEGAAVGHVCASWSAIGGTPGGVGGAAPVRFVELRVVSNTTGDRATQRWDIKLALARLGELARKASELLEAS